MTTQAAFIRSNAKRITAGFLALSAFGAMRLTASRTEVSARDVAGRFVLTRSPLPEVDPGGIPARHFRQLHPKLSHIQAFMSSLGAGAALHDLDGNGLPDDVCYV